MTTEPLTKEQLAVALAALEAEHPEAGALFRATIDARDAELSRLSEEVERLRAQTGRKPAPSHDPAIDPSTVSLGHFEAMALTGLGIARDSHGEDYCVVTLATIAADGDLPRTRVRRAVRSLARKGLARYVSGCFNEDGEMFGSGYMVTDAGYRRYLAMRPEAKPETPAAEVSATLT